MAPPAPRPAIGLLYPGYSAQDDYPALERRLGDAGPRLPLRHTSVGEDAHRVDALLDLGSAERLTAPAQDLVRHDGAQCVLWACTSGSFVFGWEGAHRQALQVSDACGVPASSTSLAFVAACRALGLTRVAVAASYPQDVATHFRDFLAHGDIEVTALGSHGIVTAVEVGTLGRDDVLRLAAGVDRSGAQAVLVPDTAMHSLAWLPDLEEHLGLPVLTANQVTVFEGLRLLDPDHAPSLPGLGALFADAGTPA